MTEDEYQAIIIPLRQEATEMADALVDYLVSQPPKRLAKQEAQAFMWWCLTAGAKNSPAILERDRRKSLARPDVA